MPGRAPSGPPSGGGTAPNRSAAAKRKRRLWYLAGIVVLVGIVILLVIRRRGSARESARSASATGPIAVTVAQTGQGDMGIYVNALGSVTPVYTVMVRSRVDGQLMSVNYRQGELVREGDILVEIDPRPFEAQLLQAEGQYERDLALLENARLDLKRYQTAYLKKAVPEQTLATQQATVHQDEGTVKLDQALVDNARLQLSYCRIASPVSGRVGLRLVDPGNIVHASDANPMVIVTQVQPITVIFSVAEDYLPQIQQQLKAGQRLAVEAWDRAQVTKLAQGEVEALDNLIDPSTGTLKIRGLFQNEQALLFPNQFVNVRMRIDTLHNTTLIPSLAVQRNAQGAFVYLVKADSTVAMQSIEVQATEAALSAVKGLAAGQKVVTDNFNRLQQGSRVTLRPASANTNSSNGSVVTQGGRTQDVR